MTTSPEGSTQPPSGRPPGVARDQVTTLVGIVATVLAALLLIAIANRGGGTSSTASTAGSGEIFRQAADEPGNNAFTASVSAPAPESTHVRASPTAPAPSSSGSAVEVQSSLASEPGLYGGTRNLSTCDSGKLVTYLQQNPSKASAWVDALNSDPTLSWSGGSRVRVDQISAYVSELTPVILRSDTRVTNNGFVNGRPDPYQSVLQAGTAVLVDRYGVPRVRCACGNPLDRPVPVTTTPTYTGTTWTGFSPTTVVVVQPPPTVIINIILVDVNTGERFSRPAGTSGGSDGPAPTPSPAASASATPTPSPPASPSPTPTVYPENRGVAGTYQVSIQGNGGSDCVGIVFSATMTVELSGRSITLTFSNIEGFGSSSVAFTGTYQPSDSSFTSTSATGGSNARFDGHFDSSGGITGTGADITSPSCTATVTGHRK